MSILEHLAAIGELASLHTTEEVEVLLRRAVAIGAVLAGDCHSATILANFVKRLVVDIGQTALNELASPLVELVKIVGSIMDTGPFEPQPADVVLDRVHIFGILLHRVGVVEAQIGLAAILFGQTEIEADRLGMTDMEITVGLGGKTRKNRFVGTVVETLFNDFLKEIELFFVVFFHYINL